MTQSERGRVGGICRLRKLAQTKKGLDHLLHLRLISAAPAGDRGLDLVRRILDDIAAGICCFGHGNTGDLAH